MAVPKQHRSKSRQGQRRMHLHLEAKNLGLCAHCGKDVLAHTMCKNCGYYKGKQVVDVLAKLDKKERKRKEKEIAAHQQER